MIASLITFCSFLRTTWALSRGSILESYTRVKHNESTYILLSQLAGSEELILAPVSPGTVCVCVCVGWGGVCEVCGCGRWTGTYPWGSSSGYASCSQDEADTAPGQIHVHIHTVHAIKALQHWRQNSLVTLRGD